MAKHRLLKKFIPTYIYETVYDIDFQKIYDSGKRYLFIDLDNTLIPYDASLPSEEMLNLINNIRSIGFDITIVSNNHTPRIKLFSDAINSKWVSNSSKPLKKGFKKAYKMINKVDKSQVITCGDQLMTDIFGSSRFKMDSILVRPLKKKSEKWYTKLNRKMEKVVLKLLNKHFNDIYLEIINKHE